MHAEAVTFGHRILIMNADDGKLSQADRVIKALRELIPNESVDAWLDMPNRAFDNQKPRDLLRRGEVDRLWQMIFEIRAGTHV